MRILLPVLLVLITGTVSAQTEPADTSSQPAITTRLPGPPTSGAEIYGLVENTGPEEGLFVSIRLERNSDMGTIRDLVQRLEIQRVLASLSPDVRWTARRHQHTAQYMARFGDILLFLD